MYAYSKQKEEKEEEEEEEDSVPKPPGTPNQAELRDSVLLSTR